MIILPVRNGKAVNGSLDSNVSVDLTNYYTKDAIGDVTTLETDAQTIVEAINEIKNNSTSGTFDGDASSIVFENTDYPDFVNVESALNGILAKIYYIEPKITSFTMSPSTTEYEIGSTVDSLTFTWVVNKSITSQTLTDCNISLGDTVATYDTPITSTKTFTLEISDGEKTASSSKKISFLNKIYFGSTAEPTNYDSAFVLGLASNKFASSKSTSLTMNIGDGEYGYFAMPTSFGTVATVNIGGFDTDVENLGAISFTNASGHTSSYTVYRLGRTGLGNITMTI